MPDLRRTLRSVDTPGREDVTLRNTFRLLSMLVFFLMMGALVVLSLSSDVVLVTILAGVLLAQMLYILLPMDRIRARARMFWTGEAGEEVYEELEDRGGGLL
jgi:hypothetical protein